MTIAYFNKKLSEAINNVKCYVKQRLGSRNYKSLILNISVQPNISYTIIEDTVGISSWEITKETANPCGYKGIKINSTGIDITNAYVYPKMQIVSTLMELYVCQIDIENRNIHLSIVDAFGNSNFTLDPTFLEIRIYE